MPIKRSRKTRRTNLALVIVPLALVPFLAYAAWRVTHPLPRLAAAPPRVEVARIESQAREVAKVEPSPAAEEHVAAENAIDRMKHADVIDTIELDAPANERGPMTAERAFDRIMAEVRDALELRPVLVVWLFDHTASAELLRQNVMLRMTRAYPRLLKRAAACGQPQAKSSTHEVDESLEPEARLLTVVGSFGSEVRFLTEEPVSEIGAIEAALERVRSDESHSENTAAAVHAALAAYRVHRDEHGRLLKLVLVTDEAGEDMARGDGLLDELVSAAVSLDCIGYSAPFGRADDADRLAEGKPAADEIRVRRGPESWACERLALDFPTSAGIDDARLDIDSLYPPYALARLCQSSGGTYFAIPLASDVGSSAPGDGGYWAAMRTAEWVDEPSARGTFDPRKYAPRYASDAANQAELDSRPMLSALCEASRLPRVKSLARPKLVFPAADEAKLRRALDEAQKPAAVLMPSIDEMYQTLRKGEADRARPASPRQLAGYDLAMGRVLAAKARTESYLALLALLKNGRKFERPTSDTWVLEPSDDAAVTSAIDKAAQSARDYLSRVRLEHAGTPWAKMAEAELSAPMAWRWTER